MVRVHSRSERIFDLGGIRKRYSVRCQISRWKTRYIVFKHKLLFNLVKDLFEWIEGLESTRYIVFQHRLLFNLVKDLFKWIEGLDRSVKVRVQSGSERTFDLGGIRKKYSIRCQISRSKNRYIVFQHKLLFNLVKDLFKWIEGLERSVKVRVQSGSERFFDQGGIRKKYSVRCQISRWKTHYKMFQHKLLFNLVKD